MYLANVHLIYHRDPHQEPAVMEPAVMEPVVRKVNNAIHRIVYFSDVLNMLSNW